MSIIYDALKKVEKSLDKTGTSGASVYQQATTQAKIKPKFNPAYIYILIVCLGLFLGNYAFNYFNRDKKTPPLSTAVPGEPIPSQTVLTSSPSEETPATPAASKPSGNLPEPALALSGVFFEKEDGYAIINNRILKIGDEISGAKILEISLDGVKLDFNGRILKLSNP